jgi:hypothetical protein
MMKNKSNRPGKDKSPEPPVPEEVKPMTGADAVEVLKREESVRRENCWKDIQAALSKWGFNIDASTVLTSDSKIRHQLNLINAPRPQ